MPSRPSPLAYFRHPTSDFGLFSLSVRGAPALGPGTFLWQRWTGAAQPAVEGERPHLVVTCSVLPVTTCCLRVS